MSNYSITPEMFANIKTSQLERLLRVGSHPELNGVAESKETSESQLNLNGLPRDILESIVENYKKIQPSKYVLRDWVPKDKLSWYILSGNPCATEILMEKAKYESTLSEEEYELMDEEKKINWMRLCRITESTEILKKYPSKIMWAHLSSNKNPDVVDMIKERIEYEKINVQDIYEDNDSRVSFNSFCDNKNPQIIEFVKERVEYENRLSKEDYKNLDICDVLDWSDLSANPNAIELLRANPDKIDGYAMSENPNAIELLRAYPEKIFWDILSGNPNAIELLKENPKKIYWSVLSGNPNAIEMLKENPKKINWYMLSRNPNAIEMLKENPEKIHWYALSINPNPTAIELLKANPEKISWENLSKNENAFELLKERYEYEMSLSPEEYNNLNSSNKIDWDSLSKNRCIFKMV
jgi:hypothetical protein